MSDSKRRHFSDALTWIEENTPGGIALVAGALSATARLADRDLIAITHDHPPDTGNAWKLEPSAVARPAQRGQAMKDSPTVSELARRLRGSASREDLSEVLTRYATTRAAFDAATEEATRDEAEHAFFAAEEDLARLVCTMATRKPERRNGQ